ncbi:unnamed protein product [Acanthoscelides obtectus]|uniref:Uncharacterized protein n=1 Tax=Acanthoscelides obtectus TaxID=200917 RepID=A0A9P0M2V0_ACAOB|nr:unnamed protein product [Acanthoscelides obtectus]CAK1651118.1 hypothetical protein AOBTE_LOCUS17069 [Acanthoscelides obtectus]
MKQAEETIPNTTSGCGTRPKHHQQHDRSPSTSGGRMVDMTRLGPPTMVPVTADSTAFLANITEKKRAGGGAANKQTLFKCKKCNFNYLENCGFQCICQVLIFDQYLKPYEQNE